MASFPASQGFRPPSRAPAPRSSAWRAALPVGARPPGRLVFPACAPCGCPPPPATTWRIILLQRFSFDSVPAHEQPAPADLQRHPGDKFCHPAPDPWTLSAGKHHPRAGAQPLLHHSERVPCTWCARRTLPANARNRLFFGAPRAPGFPAHLVAGLCLAGFPWVAGGTGVTVKVNVREKDGRTRPMDPFSQRVTRGRCTTCHRIAPN